MKITENLKNRLRNPESDKNVTGAPDQTGDRVCDDVVILDDGALENVVGGGLGIASQDFMKKGKAKRKIEP